MSRAINILEYSSESVASETLEAPSGAGSNEADLTAKIERINRVIQKASFYSFSIARGLTAASENFATTDNQEAADFGALHEYGRDRGA